jgi:hypothetical protein
MRGLGKLRDYCQDTGQLGKRAALPVAPLP